MATEQQHFDAARKWQEYLQREVGDEVGFQVPAPTLGQTSPDYQRETMRLLKKTYLQHHRLNEVNMRGLPNDALQPMWNTVIPAVKTEASNPATVPKGEIREVVKTDANGLKVRHFIGQDHFTKFMMRAGRRVVSFRTDQGYVDASGRGLR